MANKGESYGIDFDAPCPSCGGRSLPTSSQMTVLICQECEFTFNDPDQFISSQRLRARYYREERNTDNANPPPPATNSKGDQQDGRPDDAQRPVQGRNADE